MADQTDRDKQRTAILLINRLASPRVELRRDAASGLAQIALPQVVETLRKHLPQEPDAQVRATIVRSLCSLNAPRLLETLESLLDDADPKVAAAVLAASQRLEASDTYRIALVLSDARHPNVREEARALIDRLPKHATDIRITEPPPAAETVRGLELVTRLASDEEAPEDWEVRLLTLAGSEDRKVRLAALNGLRGRACQPATATALQHHILYLYSGEEVERAREVLEGFRLTGPVGELTPLLPVDLSNQSAQSYAVELGAMLAELKVQGGEALHLVPGLPPLIKLRGELLRTSYPQLVGGNTWAFACQVLGLKLLAEFERDWDMVVSVEVLELGRFEAALWREQNGVALALRPLPSSVEGRISRPLPAEVMDLARLNDGLVVVGGAPQSGKTTTWAALVDRINHDRKIHLVTVQGPSEYIFAPAAAKLTQREVGSTTRSATAAIGSALHADPQVIALGNLRAEAELALLLEAAETGRLVLTTVPGESIRVLLDYLTSLAPRGRERSFRRRLGHRLRAVTCQTMVEAQGLGRIPVFDVLRITSSEAAALLDGPPEAIAKALAVAGRGNLPRTEHLKRMVQSGLKLTKAAGS